MLLSRIDAAQHLGISTKTLDRRIASGALTAIFGEPNRLGKRTVFVDFPELKEPTPEPAVVASEPEPEPKPTVRRETLSNVELKAIDDLIFAEAYKTGQATDTMGNRYDGTNTRFPEIGRLSLVGAEERPRERLSTTSHMNAALVATPGPSANSNYINSLEYSLVRGNITKDQYDEMTNNATKARIPEQLQKQFVDRQAIYAAFMHGYSR